MPIGVVGVTSHQGGQESWSQGKGAQVVTRETPSRYAKCGAPKGKYLSTSLEGCGHWKAQCGDKSHAAFGEGPMEKDCSRSTSPAAYSTPRGVGCGKASRLPYSRQHRYHPCGRGSAAWGTVRGEADRQDSIVHRLRGDIRELERERKHREPLPQGGPIRDDVDA